MGTELKLNLTGTEINNASDFNDLQTYFSGHFNVLGEPAFTSCFEKVKFQSIAGIIKTSLNDYLDSRKEDFSFFHGMNNKKGPNSSR